jgi:hypothetical protein
MNAERLHAIARELKADFEATDLPSLMEQLAASPILELPEGDEDEAPPPA